MKKSGYFSIALTALLLAGIPPLRAQDTAAAEPFSEAVVKKAPAAKKKPVKKKKKPAVKEPSEYKFDKIEHTPAYKFDKKTNPIIKAKPKKKGAAKGKKAPAKRDPAPAARPKLKSSAPAEGEGPPAGRQFPEEGADSNG